MNKIFTYILLTIIAALFINYNSVHAEVTYWSSSKSEPVGSTYNKTMTINDSFTLDSRAYRVEMYNISADDLSYIEINGIKAINMFTMPGYCADPGQGDNTRRLRKCMGMYGSCPDQASYYGTKDITNLVRIPGTNTAKVYAQDLCGGNLGGSVYLRIYKYDLPGEINSISGNAVCGNNGQSNTINWSNSSNANYYNILRDGAVIPGSGNITGTSYVDNNPSGDHTYKVIAINSWGVRESSSIKINKLNCIDGLTINPVSASLFSEQSQQFSAELSYKDGSKKNVTNIASWITDANIGAMSGSSKGLFNAVKIDSGQDIKSGYVNVSYTEDSQTKTAKATVIVSPYGSLKIKGDVFAEKNITGINVDKNSVIVTKTTSNVTGSQWQINKYNPTELLQLSKFIKKMNLSIDRLISEYGVKSTANDFSGNAFYLNNGIATSPIVRPAVAYIDKNNVKPEGKVWVIDENKDLVINNSTTIFGIGTIILKSGNLIINQNINYDNSGKNSVGFIVLNGNIEIGADVTSLRGAYYASNGNITFK